MDMNKERILSALVSTLNENLPLISSLDDENIKKAVFGELCEQVFAKYENETVQSLRLMVEYMSEINSVEETIADMNNRVDNRPLLQSKKREDEDGFDAKYGTSTRYIVEQFEMNESISLERLINSTRYYPSPIATVRAALDRLEHYQINYADYIFIDIGSGMGRNLLIASDYPFQKIVGVEISSHLHAVALSNMEKYHSETQQCTDIELLCTDALSFSFPNQNMVIYFWEPFTKLVSDPFIKQLSNFVRQHRVDVVLIFLEGVFPAVANATGLFKKMEVFQTSDLISDEGGYFTISLYSSLQE